jgi:hypothetical protein
LGAQHPLGSDQTSDHLIVLQTALGVVRAWSAKLWLGEPTRMA